MKRVKPTTELILLAIVSLCVLGFFVWQACSSQKSFSVFIQKGHYNYLTDAFMAGQLNFLIKPSPELLLLPNPYDPKSNSRFRLHDASLYKGRYYAYFGPAPVLTVYIPYQLITGKGMSDHMAALIFIIGIFFLGVMILYKMRRIFAPRSNFALLLICVVAFGFLNPFGYLLREPSVYEVAINSGCFWFLLCCYLLFCFSTDILDKGFNKYQVFLLAFAAISFGLAVSSRAMYLLSGIIFLLPLCMVWLFDYNRKKSILKAAIAIGLPLSILGSLLLLYNYLRFDNVFETGLTYQLVSDLGHMNHRWSFANIVYNFYLYFFLPLKPDHIFPFFHLTLQSDWKHVPQFLTHIPQYYGPEPIMGVLPNIPFVFGFFFLKFSIISKRFKKAQHRFLLIITSMLFIPCALNIFVLLVYSAASQRYLIDFLPYLLLLSSLGWLTYIEKIDRVKRLRLWIMSLLPGILLGWSILVSLGISMTGYHNSLLLYNKELFRKIEYYFSSISSIYHRNNLEEYGGLDLRVQFLVKESGIEVLAVAWPWTGKDIVLVQYMKESAIRFGMLHMNRIFWSLPFKIDTSITYPLTIRLGSLYPQPSPYLLKLGYIPEQKNKLEILLDGKNLLSKTLEFQESHPKSVYVREGTPRMDLTVPWFSGKYVSDKRLPLSLSNR